jgi:SAM-dependent methyltransferase
MINDWDHEMPEILDIVSRESLRDTLNEIVKKILGILEKSDSEIQEITNILFGSILVNNVEVLEKTLHSMIGDNKSSQAKITYEMQNRAEIIFKEIEQHLCGDSLADVGCGHGLVSWLARTKFKEVTLFDVVDYRDSKVFSLPFLRYDESQEKPFTGDFDCILLITVLHHAKDPEKLLKYVWERTKKRLIIIESVFGVTQNKNQSPLYDLNEEEQCCYAVFCDWFYNRVLNQDIPVPYNFDTPQKWKTHFQEKLSATVSYEEDLAIDIPIVPEHHFLFVLDKK